jgi:hypothetical protein
MFGLPLLLLLSCAPSEGEFARARVISSMDETIGGPKALAQPGDIIMENDHFRIAITAATRQQLPDRESVRSSIGPSLFGGSLIDADLQWNDPRFKNGFGRDQFAELFPTVNMNVVAPAADVGIEILEDGSNGRAVVRVDSEAVPFLTMLQGLWALVKQPDTRITHDYIVEAGVPWVTMNTVVHYGWDGEGDQPDYEPAGYHDDPFPIIDWAIETGTVLGDFYLSGGSVDVFAPGIGFDEDGAVFQRMKAGDNTFLEPFEFPFIAGVGDGVSYGIASSEGQLFVPLFTASQTVAMAAARDGDGTADRFPDGTSLNYERYFFIGHGDVASIVDQFVEARGIPSGRVSGFVVEQFTGDSVSGAQVFVYEKGATTPWSQFEADVHPEDTNGDGSFTGLLPVGDWELLVHDSGRQNSDRIPITITEDGDINVQLVAPRSGALSFDVVDETGRWVPSKVSIYRVDGPGRRDPVLGDGFVGSSPEFVVFPMYGEGTVELPPGLYQAIATRGIEYEIDVSETFEIRASKAYYKEFQVVRSVETDGWISADFHVHSIPSFDSGVTRANRVRTMVCEGVEFFASTDHDYLTDFGPTVDDLGMEEWVQTAVGTEVTTLEVGHFLGFPMMADHLGDAGGAIDWTDMTPDEILAELESYGTEAGFEAVTFVGHPRDGLLGYFDQYGWDPYTGQIATPSLSLINPLLAPNNLSWSFDAIELLNGKRMELIRTPTQPELDGFGADPEGTDVYDLIARTLDEQEDLENGVYRLGYGVEGQVDDWFTLLNQGLNFTALGNSDTHGISSVESGCPRNFVVSETDDPAFIDDQAIATAVKNFEVVASYGPFVRMWVDDNPIGSTFVPDDGELEIAVEVQAPSWIAVDRIELYENGKLIDVAEVARPDGPLHVIENFVANPSQDSWYVAIVIGNGDLAPVFTPVEIPYVELQVIISEALGGVDSVSSLLSPAIPVPREYEVHPFALTNPVWADLDGGGFQPPGVASWLLPPVASE